MGGIWSWAGYGGAQAQGVFYRHGLVLVLAVPRVWGATGAVHQSCLVASWFGQGHIGGHRDVEPLHELSGI